jgi:hypothetical protein
MIEQRCAENNDGYFHYEAVRLPHDDEPDF